MYRLRSLWRIGAAGSLTASMSGKAVGADGISKEYMKAASAVYFRCLADVAARSTVVGLPFA